MSVAIGATAGCLGVGRDSSSEPDRPNDTPTPTPPPFPTPTPDELDDVVMTESTPLYESPITPRWEVDLPGQYELSTPAIDDDTLYIGSRREMTAVDLDTGNERWQVDLGAMTRAFTAAVSDDFIIASARNVMGRNSITNLEEDQLWEEPPPYSDATGGQLVAAIDKSDGSFIWEQEHPVSSSPILVDDEVIFATYDDGDAGVMSIEPTTGEERWHEPLDTPGIFAAPAVDDAGIYIASTGNDDDDSILTGLTRDGDVEWSTTLDGEIYKGPAVREGQLAIGTGNSYAASFGVDGDLLWEHEVDNGVYTTPAIGDDQVFVTDLFEVAALDRDTGEEHWRGDITDDARAGVSLSEDKLHVGGLEIAAFDRDGETAHWRVELPGAAGSFGAPLYIDGVVYTGACIKRDASDWYHHVLYALD